MRHLVIAAALLLGACHSEEARDKIRDMEVNAGAADAAAPDTPAPAAATAVAIERKDALVDFYYGWPAEAAAIPSIDARFRAEARKSLDELVAGAAEDRKARTEEGFDFNGHMTAVKWESFGRSPRLLSLASTIESYTGGAHPNHGTGTLLWDREAGREVGFKGLFESEREAFDRMRDAWCSALDKERAKRRGSEFQIAEADDPFNKCPGLDEIAVIPSDRNKDGLFETLDVRADPYVAGPYAEGDYQFELPVTARLIAAMKAEYRASFAV